MKNNIKLICAIAALSSCSMATAQVDPHFSQYYAYPVWLNPALTGAIDGDYRVTTIYRNQWSQVTKAFNTIGASADFATDNSLNLGVNVLTQTAGEGGYRYTTAYATAAYTGLKFGNKGYHRVIFALQAGMLDRRFDPSKLSYGDQWNPSTGYDPSNPTGEVINRYSSTKFDAGAGLLYYDANPGKMVNFFGGFSTAHLTRPEDEFVSGSSQKIPFRYTIHGGARIALSEQLSVTPNLLYMRQGNQEEKMLGAYVQLKADTYTDLLVGGSYRLKDAVVPFAGFNYKNIVLGISYDVNASSLKDISRSPNAFEISLSFAGRKMKSYPAEPFICPRL